VLGRNRQILDEDIDMKNTILISKICEYCKKEFISEKEFHQNCTKRKAFINEVLNKEYLKECYRNGLTSSAISRILEEETGIYLDAGTIIDLARRKGIKTPNIRKSARNKRTRSLYKKTCLSKYGCKNASEANFVKQKKVEKALQKYGTINVFQAEEIKQKSKKTCLEKYGVESFVQSHLYDKYRNYGRLSKIHQKVSSLLDVLKIKHENEVCELFPKYNSYLGRVYSPIVDICLEDRKIVIEINGDMYHANPLFYKENDIVFKFKGKTMVRDIWEFDKSRKEQIESFGYKVITLWENDILKNFNKIEQIIRSECL
jgi:very-short-patch-repair endonuclease